jgi:hypothetical protein
MEMGFVHSFKKTDKNLPHTLQSFVQRRKEIAELESLAELAAVEASLYTHKQNSEPEGHMSSNITRANTQKCRDFDLNDVTYEQSNIYIENMQTKNALLKII